MALRSAAVPQPSVRNEVLFRGELFTIGRFAAPRDAPDFSTAGPIVSPVFVFPRTSVWIQHEGKSPFVGDVHSVAFYNTGQPYRREAISPSGDVCDWFRVKGTLAREVARFGSSAGSSEAPFRYPRAGAPPKVALVERALFHQLQAGGRTDALHVEETALALLCRLLLDATAELPGSPPLHRDLAEAARASIGAAAGRNVTLKSIASDVGCSPFHLCRTFHRQTGITLNGYRDRVRVSHAFDLVLDRGLDLTEAALQAGYSSHSHFTWAFKRTFSTTPSLARTLARAPRQSLRDTVRRLLTGA